MTLKRTFRKVKISKKKKAGKKGNVENPKKWKNGKMEKKVKSVIMTMKIPMTLMMVLSSTELVH